MRDLTQGSVPAQVIGMAVPIAVGMVFQTLVYRGGVSRPTSP